MTPEQRGQAGLAVIRALIREQQLVEAVAPLDQLLTDDDLDPVAHRLGDHLALVRADLLELGQELAPVTVPTAAGADPAPTED